MHAEIVIKNILSSGIQSVYEEMLIHYKGLDMKLNYDLMNRQGDSLSSISLRTQLGSNIFFQIVCSLRGQKFLLGNYQSRHRRDGNECKITKRMELMTKARVLTRTIKCQKVNNIPENPLFTRSNFSFCVNALPSVLVRSLTSFSDRKLPVSTHWQHNIVKRKLTTSYIR